MTPPPLTAEQQATVAANLGLVGMVINQLHHHGPDEVDEAYQDGVSGLGRAAQLFDPDMGYQFSTYATQWIRQAIQRGYENRQGVNYRRHVANGTLDQWDKPHSLDKPLSQDGYTTLADTLTANDNTSDEATSNTATAVLLAHLHACCRDDLDRHIVTHLTNGDVAWHTRCGREHGLSGAAIQKRHANLMTRTAARINRHNQDQDT